MNRRIRLTPVVSLIATVLVLRAGLFAQDPEASSYPVDSTAAAGMTSGLPNGTTYRQAEMVGVRTSAQGAAGEASAAMMARSADQSIEERNREQALQTARTNKAIKEEMRNRLKFERVAAVQNKVTSNEMSTWQQNGGVRVERNVPDAFLTALIQEEEQAALKAGEGEKKRFSLFGGDDDKDDGPGFLSSIRPPRLPFIGGGDDTPESAPVASTSDNSEPVFATNASSSRSAAPTPAPSAPAPVAERKPGTVPMISGAALVDGRSTGTTVNNSGSPDSPPASSQPAFASDRAPEPETKKSGFFSMFQGDDEAGSDLPGSRESSSGGGFFGFGRKKPESNAGGTIDASLFPDGAVNQAPRGGSLGRSAVAADAAEDASFASSSTGSIVMPGETVEKSRGFSLPKPSLSLPTIPSLTKSENTGGATTSTGYHVVTNTAQFMVYGAEQMQSEIRALPAGTSVLVTKPGEQWSGIRLDDGTEGIVQNKNLRPSS